MNIGIRDGAGEEQGSHPTPCSCTGLETRHRTSPPVSLHPAEHKPQLPTPNTAILLSKQEDENPSGTRESWKPLEQLPAGSELLVIHIPTSHHPS